MTIQEKPLNNTYKFIKFNIWEPKEKSILMLPEIFTSNSISLTKMAEKMLFTEMPQQFVIVEVALITKFAQRMTSVWTVIFIALSTMFSQVIATVVLAINAEQLSTQKQNSIIQLFTHMLI